MRHLTNFNYKLNRTFEGRKKVGGKEKLTIPLRSLFRCDCGKKKGGGRTKERNKQTNKQKKIE